jgi:hypothetical protein
MHKYNMGNMMPNETEPFWHAFATAAKAEDSASVLLAVRPLSSLIYPQILPKSRFFRQTPVVFTMHSR